MRRRRVVRAEQFEVVDSEGHVRARLGTADGSRGAGAVLSFYDANGGARMMFGIDDDTPSCWLLDSRGKKRIAVAVEDEASGVVLYDAEEIRRVSMSIDDAGSRPGVGVYDSRGRLRAFIDVEDDEPNVLMLDADGDPWWWDMSNYVPKSDTK